MSQIKDIRQLLKYTFKTVCFRVYHTLLIIQIKKEMEFFFVLFMEKKLISN